MKALFVDTGGWMAIADDSDPAHVRLRLRSKQWLEAGGSLVSTDYVADETLTLLRTRAGLAHARRWWEQVEGSGRIRWEHIDHGRAEKARRWFFSWRDKEFSFTDCTSFVVMKELRLTVALGTDKHFTQAGFELTK